MNNEEEQYLFSEEEIENIKQLIVVLLQIRARLKSDGIDIDAEGEKLGINEKGYPARGSGVDN